jgi:hypothetical protein
MFKDVVMRLIILLLTILGIGWVYMTLIDGSKNEPQSTATETIESTETPVALPKVSSNPQDVKKFKKDINQFMQQSFEKRDEELKEME